MNVEAARHKTGRDYFAGGFLTRAMPQMDVHAAPEKTPEQVEDVTIIIHSRSARSKKKPEQRA